MVKRRPYQPSSFDQWALRNSALCLPLGGSLITLGTFLIFLNEFEVITGPLRFLSFLPMGFGVALVLTPGNVRKRLDD